MFNKKTTKTVKTYIVTMSVDATDHLLNLIKQGKSVDPMSLEYSMYEYTTTCKNNDEVKVALKEYYAEAKKMPSDVRYLIKINEKI